RALSAKVTGFMLKDAPAAQLADAIRNVAAGRRVVDSQLAMAAWDSAECPLTPREIEVLRLTAEGMQAVDIAGRLFLSVGTVRNYLTTIISKLTARNRVDAIRIARDAGWL
ncbi:response regulator transcription factor, partial [Actinophytocola sp.]|uniref:response regulator transcription factor n=1 Tax=Actinophytocola sp. TaxID=1872138 RepID=UPI002ED56702